MIFSYSKSLFGLNVKDIPMPLSLTKSMSGLCVAKVELQN